MNSIAVELSEENKRTLTANYAANIRHIKAARGVNEWKGRFSGKSVIVAGAGPSLDAALPTLAGDHGIPIIACDRAARPLLAAGVKPFCTVAVEMHELGAKKYDGAPGLADVPLVFDPLCATKTIEAYPGPRYTYNRHRLVSGKGDIRIGHGVVVSAVGVAELTGASRVILVGVDLSYPGGVEHASGATVLDEPFEGRTPIAAANGDPVLSDIYFIINVMELSDACSPALEIVQTSTRGAYINRARHMSLSDCLKAEL